MACEREHDWEVCYYDRALKASRVCTVISCSPRAAHTRVEAIAGKLGGNALMSRLLRPNHTCTLVHM
jgi:hypothetical protein